VYVNLLILKLLKILHLTFIENVSAVSILGGRSGYSINNLIKGVIRFIEIPDGCIIDGIVKGLSLGEHGMHIHEYGDITNGCNR